MIYIDAKKVIETRIAESMGFNEYKQIVEMVRKTDVSSDSDFQRTFNAFYRVRRNAEWRKAYYDLFEKAKGIYEHTMEEIRSLPDLESKLTVLQQEVLQKTKAGENTDDLKTEIDRIQERKYVLQIETARLEGIRRRIQDLEEYLNEPVTEYDDSLVRKLIEKITVYDDRCDVEFKSGIIVEVYI